jgi:hypothetical protein
MDQRLPYNNINDDTLSMESESNDTPSTIIQQQLQVLLLLAQVAVKVARRSNLADRQLVLTCLENYYGHPHHNHNNNHKNYRSITQQLVEENAQLRDIVMGRIAAFAMDPSSLQRQQQQQETTHTAVSVLDTFHQAMAAHAVSNHNVKHLILDWMIPSSQQLPRYSLACIVRSIAQEVTATMPVNGQVVSTSSVPLLPTLQQLSMPVMTQLLGPVLQLCVHNQQTKEDDQDNDSPNVSNIMLATTVVTALQALQAWCTVTDLSIAQVQHLCNSKVRVGTCV